MNRKKFVGIAAGTVTAAVSGYALYEYTPWLDYAKRSRQIRRPFVHETGLSIPMQEIIRYAALAASGHNTQPWKFAVRENAIEIHPDFTRRLPAVDPDDRELWISLGCALENLTVAARAAGYSTEITYPDTTNQIGIRLKKEKMASDQLFDAIPHRQNTRSEYDGRPVATTEIDKLRSVPLEPGVELRFFTSRTERDSLLEYVTSGNRTQFADKPFMTELAHWIRFNKRDALFSGDGLYSGSSGNPDVPRWLGQMVLKSTRPEQQADTDALKLRSSSGAILVTSASDNKTAWVRTGQVYERMALQMTLMNIKSAFLNQPNEVAALRLQFQKAIGLGTAKPQLLFRYGYAASLPYSLRRPLDTVMLDS